MFRVSKSTIPTHKGEARFDSKKYFFTPKQKALVIKENKHKR